LDIATRFVTITNCWVMGRNNNNNKYEVSLGKHRALSRRLTCNFRLYLKKGWTSIYHCLHTGVPYNTAYGWNRPNV